MFARKFYQACHSHSKGELSFSDCEHVKLERKKWASFMTSHMHELNGIKHTPELLLHLASYKYTLKQRYKLQKDTDVVF